jgi:hypothetical protein
MLRFLLHEKVKRQVILLSSDILCNQLVGYLNSVLYDELFVSSEIKLTDECFKGFSNSTSTIINKTL